MAAQNDDNDTGAPAGGVGLLEEVFVAPDKGYVVILSNDPVNLINIVVKHLQRILKIDDAQAMAYAELVHNQGKGAVFHGSAEECDTIVQQLQEANLWAHRTEA